MLLGSTSVKAVGRMLIKLSPGVDFTNIILAAFTSADPKRAKKAGKSSVSFAPLGSVHVKAAHKMLATSTPGVDTIFCLQAKFQ